MYRTNPHLILGFHGCGLGTAKQLINSPNASFQPSHNDYDWLGSGMYFWEGNEERSLEYAKESIERRKGRANPAVVGAILDLGRCLNLMEKYHLDELAYTHKILKELFDLAGQSLPINHGGADRFLRKLDCAVIELHHRLNEKRGQPYDSVRAVFPEAGELYPGAGFTKKAHIQISIRNPNCIKGFFWPRKLNYQWSRV